MRKQIFNNKIFRYMGVMMAIIIGQSCSDLEPVLSDSVPVESAGGEFTGVANAQSSLDGLYNGINNIGNQTDAYALEEVAAENIAVLTRGADWGDNGVWRLLHNHGWNASHLYVLNAWNNRNAQILNATRLLDPRSSASGAIVAQAQVLRALNAFMVLNFYGVVPFREVDEGPDVNPRVMSTQEAFDFVITDLNAAISSGNLNIAGPEGDTFIIGEAAARFIRAKVNLQAEAILGSAVAGAYDQVIADVTAIENMGFTLDLIGADESYFDIWDSSTNSEVIQHLNFFTGSRVFNQIHPNQTGWNGFVTLAETVALYGSEDQADDARLGPTGPEVNGVGVGILRGQQLGPDGAPLTDRSDVPLIYENAPITSLEINNERNGLRVVKYPQRDGDVRIEGGNVFFDGNPAPGSDFVFFRFAEALLMRAEASLRGGAGADPAADINAVRTRAGAAPLGSVALTDVYDEYRREMNGESNINGQRSRQIRFGTFAEQWEAKTVQDDFRNLYPIPSNALGSNPNLVQNPGY